MDDNELVEFCCMCGLPKPWHKEFALPESREDDARWACSVFTSEPEEPEQPARDLRSPLDRMIDEATGHKPTPKDGVIR